MLLSAWWSAGKASRRNRVQVRRKQKFVALSYQALRVLSSRGASVTRCFRIHGAGKRVEQVCSHEGRLDVFVAALLKNTREAKVKLALRNNAVQQSHAKRLLSYWPNVMKKLELAC